MQTKRMEYWGTFGGYFRQFYELGDILTTLQNDKTLIININ